MAQLRFYGDVVKSRWLVAVAESVFLIAAWQAVFWLNLYIIEVVQLRTLGNRADEISLWFEHYPHLANNEWHYSWFFVSALLVLTIVARRMWIGWRPRQFTILTFSAALLLVLGLTYWICIFTLGSGVMAAAAESVIPEMHRTIGLEPWVPIFRVVVGAALPAAVVLLIFRSILWLRWMRQKK